jgi:hypothetical protein
LSLSNEYQVCQEWIVALETIQQSNS